MNSRRVIIVGPSGSGKTSVARAVASKLGVPCISMDDYRTKARVFVWVRTQHVRNFEHPSCWDANAVVHKLAACQHGKVGFVVEGNHLLSYSRVACIDDAERFYLNVPFKVSLERRKTRHRYLPADESFALIGEEQTRLWVWPQQALPGVMVLDGTQPVETIVEAILAAKQRTLCKVTV